MKNKKSLLILLRATIFSCSMFFVAFAPNSTMGAVVADLNQDGAVDIQDVQLCVNVILETETNSSIISRADVNGDGSVNVLDVQEIINAIYITCARLSGTICPADETCSGSWLNASDSERCCGGECEVNTTSNAEFIFQSVPTTMNSGQKYEVSVTMKNTGTSNWTKEDNYRLGSQNPQDNKIWGYGRVNLDDGEIIKQGEVKTFYFIVTAPSTLGAYNFQWRMLREYVEWFGEKTLSQTINVTNDSLKINPKLGVTHMAGKYPQLGEEFLIYGAKDLLNLGFQAIEVSLSKMTYKSTDGSPNGHYQTLDWGDEITKSSLKNFVQHPRYKELLDMPFETFFFTTSALIEGAGSQWFIANAWDARFTEVQLELLYKDYYDFTKYLLETYENTGKTFVIQSTNEMDWQLIANKADDPLYRNVEPDDFAIQNAIDFWNTIQDAIEDARDAHPATSVKVYHGCEVNRVQRAMDGYKTATNDVLPYTHCDLYGYSHYDTLKDFSAFIAALDLISQKAPNNEYFGNKNVYVSELGIPETEYLDTFVQNIKERIEGALNWGVPYILYWQIYDNGCDSYDNLQSCRGFWIKKPTSELSDIYSEVYLDYSVE